MMMTKSLTRIQALALELTELNGQRDRVEEQQLEHNRAVNAEYGSGGKVPDADLQEHKRLDHKFDFIDDQMGALVDAISFQRASCLADAAIQMTLARSDADVIMNSMGNLAPFLRRYNRLWFSAMAVIEREAGINLNHHCAGFVNRNANPWPEGERGS